MRLGVMLNASPATLKSEPESSVKLAKGFTLNPKPYTKCMWGLIKIMGPFGVCIIVYSL